MRVCVFECGCGVELRGIRKKNTVCGPKSATAPEGEHPTDSKESARKGQRQWDHREEKTMGNSVNLLF